MFSHIVSGQTAPEGFDGVIRLAEEQLPNFQGLRGFKGFYLLTDRDGGNFVTISLWDTREDIRQAVEGGASHEAAKEAAKSIELTSASVKTYQVEIAQLS